jgi:hypothetical protein
MTALQLTNLDLHRRRFHQNLLDQVLLINDRGVASNADGSSRLSVLIALEIFQQLQKSSAVTNSRLAGQTSGNAFESLVADFVRNAFSDLEHLRPGIWDVRHIGNRNRRAIADFEQYAHLIALDEAARGNAELAAALGSDYTITPDVVIARQPETDKRINAKGLLVSDNIATRTVLRQANGVRDILHASISTKWTIRSDRSQNSRTEALNLMRNRKGRVPHIAVVTAEPLPTRLASIALGTGDIDCVYHFALPELIQAVQTSHEESAIEMLNIMVNGKRLKDIADLPLDLAI